MKKKYSVVIPKPGHFVTYKNVKVRTPFTAHFETKKECDAFKSHLIVTGILPKEADKKIVLGCVKDPIDVRDYKIKTILKKDLSVTTAKSPLKLDYSKKMTPVKDQGNLGSCVGFAVSAVKEYQEYQDILINKKDKRLKKDVYDLSEQWAYYKAKEIDPWPYEEGTSIRYALKQICKLGIPPERCWPYNDSNKGKPTKDAPKLAKWGVGKKYYRIDDLDELITTLNEVGPVVIGIECFEEIFYVGSDGMIPYPDNPNYSVGGHAICVVGYDTENKLIKFKNSWGSYWGNRGYGYLSFKYINDFMIDAWALVDKD